jgi:hypothetical protein
MITRYISNATSIRVLLTSAALLCAVLAGPTLHPPTTHAMAHGNAARQAHVAASPWDLPTGDWAVTANGFDGTLSIDEVDDQGNVSGSILNGDTIHGL